MFAWCGPQPNSRLVLNYGIVDEQNPNDKMTITATIPNNDPLFPQKRYLLQQHNMSSQQSFQLQRHHVSHTQYMRVMLSDCESCSVHVRHQLHALCLKTKEDNLHAILSHNGNGCAVPPMSVKSHAWAQVQHVTT